MRMKPFAIAVVLGAALVGGAVYWMIGDDRFGRRVQPVTRSSTEGGVESTAIVDVPTQSGPTAKSTESAGEVGTLDIAVTTGRIEGVVTDAEGRAIEGIVLHALAGTDLVSPSGSNLAQGVTLRAGSFSIGGPSPSWPDIDDPRNRAATGTDGAFVIDGLPPGDYDIVARGHGYRQGWMTQIEVAAGHGARADFILEPGQSIDGIVLDPAGHPVPGARVEASQGMLQAFGRMSLKIGGSQEVEEQGPILAKSDDAGRFRLEGLASGTYQLHATHESFAEGTARNIAAGSSEVEVQMKIGVSISGVVRSPNGAPMASVTVTASAHRSTADSVQTDAEGRYAFEGLSSASLQLIAACDEYPSVRAERVQPEDGEVIENFDLQFEPGASITVSVVDPTGSPLSGARLTVAEFREDRLRFLMRGSAGLKDGVTNDEGRCAIGGLELEREYELVVRHDDYLREVIDFSTDESVVDLEIVQMRAGATIHGVVVDDASGAPITDVALRLIAERDGGRSVEMGVGTMIVEEGASKSAQTDSSGQFGMTAFEPGDYRLRATAVGFAPYQSEVITVSGSVPVTHDIRLGDGLSIAGTVFDSFDRPLPGASVQVSRSDELGHDAMNQIRREVQASAVSDAEGRFGIAGLEPGEYAVTGRRGSLAPTTLTGIQAGDQAVTLTLLDLGGIRGVVLDLAARTPVESFSAKMTKARDRDESFVFDLSTLSDGATFKDPDGQFLMNDLVPGKYTLTVKAGGFVEHRAEVTIISDTIVEVEVPLDIGGAIDGYVRSVDGRPIESVRVRHVVARKGGPKGFVSLAIGGSDYGETMSIVEFSSGPNTVSTATDANGYFLLNGLPPGEVDVEYHHPDFIDRTLEKTSVPRARVRRLDPLSLEKGSGVRGRVMSAAGDMITLGAVKIEALDEEGEGQGDPAMVGLDDEGRFESLGLASGSYRLTAHDFSVTAAAVGVDGAAQPATKVIDIDLQPDVIETVDIVLD